MIRFHLDENIHGAVADGLRRRGLDVTTTTEVKLIGVSDEVQLEYSRSEGRVLVTHDDDFIRLHQKGVKHAGISFCHLNKYSIGQLVLALAHLSRTHLETDLCNQLKFL